MAKPLVEQTAEKLKQYILDQQFDVGDRLPNEYELASVLSVGRSTIRESVRRLVAQNILEVRQGSGTYISSKKGVAEDPLGLSFVKDTLKLTKDLFEMRCLLEPRIAQKVAQRATEDEVLKLKQIIREIEISLERGDDEHLQLDVDFHSMLANMSGNIAMDSLVPMINQSIQLINDNFTNRQMKEDTVQSHRDIVNAIENQDGIAAYNAMLLHILTVQKSLNV